MAITFDKDILKQNCMQGMRSTELVQVLKSKITYLMTHNKNYTQQQYWELQDISEIIQAMKG